ncbi:alpha-amylase family glycosyl hydrolase [Deinococcus sonorensis]|uniref:Alpha-amylase family glycosyl hydrolase n=1 Tax=Deinococcus sonorensis KR-87 TaxID=694439 RepID=A0AAU7U935_9DEIO
MKPLALTTLLLAAGAQAQSAAPAALPDWTGQIIYQVMPDRFSDGDATNNQGVDKTNLRAWHGGDLTGLTSRLNYIQTLGATAVWLTPIYQQKDGLTDGTAGYHGYWPYDFRSVDPHFGTLAQFQGFTQKAHSLNLRVMLDQVINHYGPGAPATREHPGWFHTQQDCDRAMTPAQHDTDCPLSGLPDLNQQVGEVQDLLYGNADFWRQQGVDAFRYDAIKHVDATFLQRLVTRDRAAGTFTLGEYYGADAATIREYQQLGLSSLFDFSLQDAMNRSVMHGAGFGPLRSVLTQNQQVPQPQLIAAFLDNHDLPRFASGTLFEDQGQARTAYALRALMTLPGIPVLYQGIEIAQRGGANPDNRHDMRFEDQWTPAERAVFQTAQDAITVRKASPALSGGTLQLLDVPDSVNSQLLVYTRTAGNQTVLVAWNNQDARRTYSLRSTLAGQPLTGSLFHEPGGQPQNAGMSVSGGYLHLSLPGRTAAVFVLGQ